MSKEGRHLSCSECGYTLPGHGPRCSSSKPKRMEAIPPEDGVLIRWVVIDDLSIDQLPKMAVRKNIPIEVLVSTDCKGIVAIIELPNKRHLPLPLMEKS